MVSSGGIRFEKQRRAQVVTTPGKPSPVHHPTRNLHRPRSIKFEGDWNDLIKRATASALQKIAAQAVESPRMRQLLEQIADYYQESNPEAFSGQSMTRREWLDQTLSDPDQLADAFFTFGQQSNSPMFQLIGAKIAN